MATASKVTGRRRRDRDICRSPPVTPARHRTVDCVPASLDHELTQSADLGRVGGGHLHPDLAGRNQRAHRHRPEHRPGARRQAGDHDSTDSAICGESAQCAPPSREHTGRRCRVAHRESTVRATVRRRCRRSETDEPNRAWLGSNASVTPQEVRHRRNVQNIERHKDVQGTRALHSTVGMRTSGREPDHRVSGVRNRSGSRCYDLGRRHVSCGQS